MGKSSRRRCGLHLNREHELLRKYVNLLVQSELLRRMWRELDVAIDGVGFRSTPSTTLRSRDAK